MANIVGSLLIKLSALTADFDAGLSKSAAHAKGWAADISKITLGNIGANLATKGLESIGGYIKQAAMYYVDLAAKMDDASDAAEKFGITLKSYLTFEWAAKKSSTSIDTIGTAINRLKRQIAEGAAGDILGIDNRAFSNLIPEEAFLKAGKIIAAIKNPVERTRVEFELFGKSGAELDSVIRKLATDYQSWADAVADEDAAQALATLSDSLEDIGQRFETFAASRVSVMQSFAEYISSLFYSDEFNEWYEQYKAHVAESTKLEKIAAQSAKSLADERERAAKAWQQAIDPLESLRLKVGRERVGEDKADLFAYGELLNEKGVKGAERNRMLQEFEGLQKMLSGLKAEKELTDSIAKKREQHIEAIKQFGTELKKATQSPLEEFQARVKEIDKWIRDMTFERLATPEDFELAKRGIADARKQAVEGMMKMKPEMAFSGMAVEGSQEAYKAITSFVSGFKRDKQESLLEQQIDNQIKQLTFLEGIQEAVEKQEVLEEVDL